MVKRNSSVPFNFVCVTENPAHVNPDIKIISLPKYPGIQGWWYKPWIFSDEFPLRGTILFLDLDIVIVKSIDNLWSYDPKKFCIIRDFARSSFKDWSRFNSSVFRFDSGKYSYVWDNLLKDIGKIKTLHGDQDWIYSQIKSNFSFWPDDWIQSYKWEVRTRSDLTVVDKKFIFKNTLNPRLDPQTSILVFHGHPKPDVVNDPVVLENWR